MDIQFEEDLTPYSSQGYKPVYGQNSSQFQQHSQYSFAPYNQNQNASPYMMQRYVGTPLVDDDDPAMIKFLIRHKFFRTQKQAKAFLTGMTVVCVLLSIALFAWASADPKVVLLNP